MAFVTPAPVQVKTDCTVLKLGYSASLNTWAAANGKENMEQRKRGDDALSYFPYTIVVMPGGYAPVLSSKIVVGAPGTTQSGG